LQAVTNYQKLHRPGIKFINPFLISNLYLPHCSQDVSGRPDHQNISICKFFNKFISIAIVMQCQIFKKKLSWEDQEVLDISGLCQNVCSIQEFTRNSWDKSRKVSPLQIAEFIKDFVPVTNFKNILQHITYCYLMTYIFTVRHTTESAGKGGI
jgi:ABC-type iron transport system FetAB permease component